MRATQPALLIICFGALFAAVGLQDLLLVRATADWPEVPGVIVQAGVGTPNEDNLYSPEIEYSYEVGGVPHAGTRLRAGRGVARYDSANAVKRLAAYAPGTRVKVRYDPRDPTNAVLHTTAEVYAPLLVGWGAFLVLLGVVALLRPMLERVMLGRPRPFPPATAAAAASGGPNGGDGPTASELVFLAAQHFAPPSVMGRVRVASGDSVSAVRLVESAIGAALLAGEKAGVWRLEAGPLPVSGATGDRTLFIEASGQASSWPAHTLESRLRVRGREEVWRVIDRWLATDSWDAWRRTAEKGLAQLVLRGFLTVSGGHGRRRYAAAAAEVAQGHVNAAREVGDELEAMARSRPEVWRLLMSHVERAVESRFDGAYRPQPGVDPWTLVYGADPWYDEAEMDYRRLDGLRLHGELRRLGWWRGIGLSIPLWSACVGMMVQDRSLWIPGVVALVVTAIAWAAWEVARRAADRSRVPGNSFAAPLRVPTWLRRMTVELRLRWVPRAMRVLSGLRWAIRDGSFSDRLAWAIVLLPIPTAATLILIVADAATWREAAILAGIPALALIVFGLRLAAGRAISRVVQGESTALRTGTIPPSPRWAPGNELPFTVQIITPSDSQPVDPASRAVVDAIGWRGREVRRLYRLAVLLLATASTLIGVVASAWSEGSVPQPIARVVFLVLTGFVLVRDRYKRFEADAADVPSASVRSFLRLWRFIRGGAADERNRWEIEVTPLRPILVPLFGAAWVIITIVVANTGGVVTAVAAIAVLVGYYALLIWRRRTLQRRYPVHPSLNLLALRVFGSPSMARFRDLLDRWQWLGPLRQLDGPDTAGTARGDVARFLTGRERQSVLRELPQVDRAVASFRERRDEQLRHEFNSIQCTDATWKVALDRMLNDADVTVMDLGGFTAANRGCVYELGRLMQKKSFDRFILLVDDDTNMDALRDVLQQAWDSIDESSPNRAAAARPIRLYHVGGDLDRQPDEDVYTWQERDRTQMREEWLLAFLRDSALSGAAPPAPQSFHWTGAGIRGPF